MGIFKFFCHLQILFYSDAFAKVRFMARNLPRTLGHHMAAKSQGVQPWVHISQLMKAPPDFWSRAKKLEISNQSNRLAREEATIKIETASWLPPPKMSDQEHVFPFFLPSLTILFLILTLWRFLWFLAVHLFCFALAWKYNAIVHIPKAVAKGGKSNLKDCLNYHDAGDYAVLSITNCSLISNASDSLDQPQPAHLSVVSHSLTLGICFLVSG